MLIARMIIAAAFLPIVAATLWGAKRYFNDRAEEKRFLSELSQGHERPQLSVLLNA